VTEQKKVLGVDTTRGKIEENKNGNVHTFSRGEKQYEITMIRIKIQQRVGKSDFVRSAKK